ncbi:MAG: hypothetical protein K1060chlam2_00628 [Chlamydiae bacterium]|nr:hypothetical protein [Chlamydiota bacterium]
MTATLLSKAFAADYYIPAVLKTSFQDLLRAASYDKAKPDEFHPYGAMVITTLFSVVVLGGIKLICKLPFIYSVRSHVILTTRFTVGSFLFVVIRTALDSINKQRKSTTSV